MNKLIGQAKSHMDKIKSSKMIKKHETHKAFTIVELAVVIVIIAILATIVVVTYKGLTGDANDTVVMSDLDNASTILETSNAYDHHYPSDDSSLKPSKSTTFDYNYYAYNNTFCLEASSTKTDKIYHVVNDGRPVEGSCPAPPTQPMQAFTTSQCSALTTFTGSNTSALITLEDPRGPQPYQEYTVGKLADGNCWMLDNLKLGSSTSDITLTSGDSNVASNFTLPQLYDGTSSSHVDSYTPYTYGPLPGDTGSGDRNYGYLYNWSAATAGETPATKPAGSSSAPYSICPSGWHLPSGEATGEFAWLNAKMNDPGASAPSSSMSYYRNWQFTGPFRGVLSGRWNQGFNNQNSKAYLWTSSPHPSSSGLIRIAYLGSNYIYPGTNSTNHYFGTSVRCILN